MLFKGFSQIDLLEREPRTLCAILAEQLALSNKAIEAQAEGIKQLRNEVDHISNQLRNEVEHISNQQMADTMQRRD